MRIFKKAFRIFCLILFLLLAASGIGISNALSSTNREKYSDNEIRIEQVDKREEDEEDESHDVKK